MGIDPKMLPMAFRMQIEAQKYRGQNNINNRRMVPAVEQRQPALAVEHAAQVRSMGSSVVRYRVSITMHRIALQDTDNKWIAPKAILDGLVQAFELPGDSERQIDYHVEQIKVAHRKDQKTVIEIEEIPCP